MSRRARTNSIVIGLALLANATLTWLLARADVGLLTPESTLSAGVLFLGVVTLAFRLTVILVLPPLMAYLAMRTLLRRLE